MSEPSNRAKHGLPFDRATINIRNLRLRTFIGFNPEERVKKQDVVLNIQISYLPSPAILNDQVVAESVSLTLEYSANTDQTLNLLEKAL